MTASVFVVKLSLDIDGLTLVWPATVACVEISATCVWLACDLRGGWRDRK